MADKDFLAQYQRRNQAQATQQMMSFAGVAMEDFRAKEAEKGDEMTLAKDLGMAAVEAGRGIISGGIKAVQETVDLAETIGNTIEESLNFGGIVIENGVPRIASGEEFAKMRKERGVFGAPEIELPNLSSPSTRTGKLVEGMAQFLAGFVGAGKITAGTKLAQLAKTSTTADVAHAAVKGAMADFTVFDEHEERLSNFLTQYDNRLLNNAMTQYLKADPTDGAIEGRLKNVIEGAGLGMLTDGVIGALRWMRSGREMQEAVAKAAEYTPESDLSILGREDLEDLIIDTRDLDARSLQEPGVDLGQVKLDESAKATKRLTPEDLVEQKSTIDKKTGEIDVDLHGKDTENPTFDFNWAMFNDETDVQKVMQRMAEIHSKGVNTARRNVISHKKTRLAANRQNAWKILKDRATDQALNNSQITAAKQLYAAAGEKLFEVARVAAAAPSAANLFAFRKMAGIYHAVQKEFLGARAEAGRALNALKIPPGSKKLRTRELEAIISDAGGRDVVEKQAKTIAGLVEVGEHEILDEFLGPSLFASTREAVHQVYINSMLSNLATHTANILGNGIAMTRAVFERAASARARELFGTEGSVELGEAMAMVQGAIEATYDTLNIFSKEGRSNLLSMPDSVREAFPNAEGKVEHVWGHGFRNLASAIGADPQAKLPRFADYLTTLSGKALERSDDVFKTYGYRMEVHALAHRKAVQEARAAAAAGGPEWATQQLRERAADLVRNPPEDIQLEAVSEATYLTFTNTPNRVLNSLGHAWQQIPVLGAVTMPFRKTPINIMTNVIERTPFAPLLSEVRADLAAGGARADTALTRIAAGSMLLSLSVDMAMNGYITSGGPSDPAQRNAMRMAGWQPYSFKAGNHMVSFNRLDPVGTMLGLGADIAEVAANIEDEEDVKALEELMIGATFSIAKQATSKTYLQGTADFVAAVQDPDRNAERFVQRVAGSLVPAGVAAVARVQDPEMKLATSVSEQIRSRIPSLNVGEMAAETTGMDFLRGVEGMPARRDLFGRPISYRPPFGSPWGEAWQLLSPVYIKEVNPEPIDQAILDLGSYPSLPRKRITVDGVELNLKRRPEMMSRYLELAGNELKLPEFGGMGAKDYLNAVVTGAHPDSIDYESGTNEEKGEFIREVIIDFRQAARRQLLQEFPELRSEYEVKRMEKQEEKDGQR